VGSAAGWRLVSDDGVVDCHLAISSDVSPQDSDSQVITEVVEGLVEDLVAVGLCAEVEDASHLAGKDGIDRSSGMTVIVEVSPAVMLNQLPLSMTRW
jgi:hypothetical protein